MADNNQQRQQYSPFAEGHRPPRRGYLTRAAEELGLAALYHCPRDVKLLCLQRFVRLFAYGGSTLVLVAYLEALGISKTRIGLFMTLTLAGDVCISFLLTLFADGIGRKAILALGAALMAGSGVVFALFEDYWVLLAAAVFGVISPSGNEIGPFRAIEESIVAHLTTSASRGDVYAWYSLIGTAGTAFGMVTTGWVIHALQGGQWVLVDAYRAVFVGYAVLGVVKLLFTLMLSGKVESEKKQAQGQQQTGERAPLLSGGNGDNNGGASEDDQVKHRRSGWRTLLPEISRESRLVMVNLCILFALDSFASGLAPLSWVAYFFRSRYNLEEGKLGSVFFVTSIISAASMLLASALAKRFGNVNTMVFTHLPSAIFLALIPIPNEVHWSLLFLVLRACTQSMDVAPRSAFLAAIVLPAERTAIMGLVNVVKTSAQSLGPTLTGLLADRGLFWVAFVCAGSLKGCYDLGLLAVFKGHEREKAERERLEAERRAADEEGH
ncbi:MFS general substrate transporter [Diplogelasinospora grovesii]|uniref:MFS general substrate transporter n=1 Tax=Diplogelasinospora grovesii TaxID=303347 RepID=A0AAN6S2A0_9PEZI|nr:MFS general substrate transporter [Diplogelasinospora grovesii]